MNSHNDNADKYSNRAEWINECVNAGLSATHAAETWDNGRTFGVSHMVAMARKMTNRAMSIGGTEDTRRACSRAAYIMLDEVSAVLAAQVSA
jgi:hypothetical protein